MRRRGSSDRIGISSGIRTCCNSGARCRSMVLRGRSGVWSRDRDYSRALSSLAVLRKHHHAAAANSRAHITATVSAIARRRFTGHPRESSSNARLASLAAYIEPRASRPRASRLHRSLCSHPLREALCATVFARSDCRPLQLWRNQHHPKETATSIEHTSHLPRVSDSLRRRPNERIPERRKVECRHHPIVIRVEFSNLGADCADLIRLRPHVEP